MDAFFQIFRVTEAAGVTLLFSVTLPFLIHRMLLVLHSLEDWDSLGVIRASLPVGGLVFVVAFFLPHVLRRHHVANTVWKVSTVHKVRLLSCRARRTPWRLKCAGPLSGAVY